MMWDEPRISLEITHFCRPGRLLGAVGGLRLCVNHVSGSCLFNGPARNRTFEDESNTGSNVEYRLKIFIPVTLVGYSAIGM